jgi:hypothetical protein
MFFIALWWLTIFCGASGFLRRLFHAHYIEQYQRTKGKAEHQKELPPSGIGGCVPRIGLQHAA